MQILRHMFQAPAGDIHVSWTAMEHAAKHDALNQRV